MTRNELQDHSGEGPIWGFVQQLTTERWTGQADVGIDPRVELCVSEGRVYFAQKSDDPPLGARLLGTGVVTSEQLRRGTVQLGDTLSLARLFQRDPSIDRDAVELMVQHLTDRLLEQVAEHPVGQVTLHPLRHHHSGIHQWFLESHPSPVPDTVGPMAVLRDVVATLSGEVPVVHDEVDAPTPVAPTFAAPSVATPAAASGHVHIPHVAPTPLPPLTPIGARSTPDQPSPFAAPAAPVVPSPPVQAAQEAKEPAAPHTASEHHTGPIVTEVPAASSLPRLGDLGLTPLPTLGAVGTRVPDPVTSSGFAPAIKDIEGLPTLATDPVTASIPIIRAAEAAQRQQAEEFRHDQPAAQLANAIAATDVRSRTPETLTLEGFTASPAKETVAAEHTSAPAVVPAHDPAPSLEALLGATLAAVPASPNANPAGAPLESPAGEIWEMVDELLGLPRQEPVAAAAASDRKGRGWLRKR